MDEYRLMTDGSFNAKSLFDQHNEHRIFTTRILLLADAKWFHMTGLVPLSVNCVVLAGLGFLLGVLARRSERLPWPLYPACTLSLCGWQYLIAPFQVGFSMMVAFSVASIVAMSVATSQRKSHPARLYWLLLSMTLYALAAFSMANGVAAAPAILFTMLLRRAPWRHIALFVMFAAAIIFLYLHGANFPAPPGAAPGGIAGVELRLAFLMVFLGGSLEIYPGGAAIGGTIMLTGVAIASAFYGWRWLRQNLVPGSRVSALLGICLFIVLNAAAASVSRAWIGLEEAAAPWYAIMSVVLAL